jgi:hypothetical protein
MSRWTAEELAVLEGTDSLTLTAGTDARQHVELGFVIVNDDLVVRAFRGASAGWFTAIESARSASAGVSGTSRSPGPRPPQPETPTPHTRPATGPPPRS